jgi:hypothetical protein
MAEEIQLATPEQLALGERLQDIFFPGAIKRRQMMRERGGRFVHYTSADSASKIIRNKTIWLRSTTAMSDYSEVQHGNRVVGTNPELPSLLAILDKEISGLGTSARDEFSKWWSDIQFSTFLASVSEHHDSEDLHGRLSMWRAFARAGARVALVFRVPLKVGRAQPLRTILHPVEYHSSAEVGAELSAIADNVVREKEFLAGADRRTVVVFAFLSLLLNVVCLKHEGFREELEWRLIYLPKLIPSPHMKWSIEQIDGVPQRIYRFPLEGGGIAGLEDLVFDKLLDRVIVGPSQYSWAMYDAFVEELRAAGITEPEKRVFVSGIPIRT